MKINLSTLVLFSVIHLVVLIGYTKLSEIEAEKFVKENFNKEKEKWTNKGTDKPYVADSLIHSTTCNT